MVLPSDRAHAALPVPALQVSTVASGLAIPWDVQPVADGLLITERNGRILLRLPSGSLVDLRAANGDVFAGSVEAGLMGLAADPGFATNRQVYTCQSFRSGSTPVDVRVLRWRLTGSGTATRIERVGAPVLTGIPIASGRHAGCRVRFAPDGSLLVGTGDAAIGTGPQNLASFGGKVLRLDAATGAPKSDNPFFSRGGNARYVWSYGHRNIQGLTIRPGTSQVWAAEHGPDRDDEVNRIVRGGNYGWNPVPGYNENVPMTDAAEFLSAVRAGWSSGSPTVATGGLTFLRGSAWGAWEGAIAVAELKGTGVRVLSLGPSGAVVADQQIAQLNGGYGRLRSVVAGDGVLYVTTSNGSNDRVLAVRPSAPAAPAYRPGLDVSPSGMAVIASGSLVRAYGRSTDGWISYAEQRTIGGAWSPVTRLPAGPVGSAPTATFDGTTHRVFVRGTDGQLWQASQAAGRTWSAWQRLGGSLTAAPAVAAHGSRYLEISIRGAGDAVYRRTWSGGVWSGWVRRPGQLSSAPTTAGNPANGSTAIQGRGASGRVVQSSVASAASTPTSWRTLDRETRAAPPVAFGATRLMVTTNYPGIPMLVTGEAASAPVIALPGQLVGAPAIASTGPARFVVAGRGTDNALWVYDGRAGAYTFQRVGGSFS